MPQKNEELIVEIVSDFVCPWCFIGDTRIEEAIRRLAPKTKISFHWLPFELNPGMEEGGADRKEHLSAKFGGPEKLKEIEARMEETGKEDGIEFRHDLIKRTPSTFKAHRLNWLAAKEGKSSELTRRLFEAYFTEGKDIGDMETLARLAGEIGMDAKKVKTFLIMNEGAEEVRQLEKKSREQGIRMVPHFIIGDEELSGAHPADVIAKTLKRALEARKAA